ncbi:SpvB/TcaC N-terminal domain-containing protein [Lewinella sp. LCG006]|uniref:SpvB/TcaC N-terminal domain-containing protein n=1 Tax=Lewinella sp. LCG006 TaxID=3231911 RepID=UPI00346075EF
MSTLSQILTFRNVRRWTTACLGCGLLMLTFSINLMAQTELPTPTEGITFIAPPQANNRGSAALAYPLNLPPGRQGIMPDLQVAYDSDNASGWLGLGWDLSLPAISIDTRWGVPRYDAAIETESYLYDGQALFPMAHRGEERPRTAEQSFYPRIESTFEQIVRHGDATTNYWWEVTDKDGTHFYYGGTPAEGVVTDAVLLLPSGAIAHWAITQVVDVNGNTVRYHYTKVSQAGNAGGTNGQELYPDYITYTGYQDSEGPFRIDFIRDRELGEDTRPDVSIDCRLGFKRVLADRLRRVEISYQSELVRAYRLSYTTGAFQKTLLESITEENAAGEDFFTHTFDYFDDVRSGDAYEPFAAPVNWSVPDDNIKGNILNPIPGMNGETSVLGGASANTLNVGGAATIGPNDFLLFSKDKTAGGTYAYGSSSNEGLIALVDINGDGLLDKIYRKNNALWYRSNLALPGTANYEFSSEERPIHGITQFSTASTSSNSYGAEGNPPFAYVGFEYTSATTTNNTYFSDFNGDGLLDIALNGNVWFNHLDDNGDPTFTTSSADTPSPINSGADLDGSLFEIDPAELEELIDRYPLHDVVRMWEAPFAGEIEIVAPVNLLEPTDPMAQSYQSDDGVRVAIQWNDLELWSASIAADDYAVVNPTGIDALTVNAGDRFYFRVQSVLDGANDQVAWSPTITYTTMPATLTVDSRDANDLLLARYQASEDFMLSAKQEVGLPLNGQVQIEGIFNKAPTSDEVIGQILLQRFVLDIPFLIPVWQDTFPADSLVALPLDLQVEVEEDDALLFRVKTDTQIDWQAIDWLPNLFYLSSPDAAVTDADGQPLFSYCPTLDLTMFNDTWQLPVPDVTTDSTTFRLLPAIDFNTPGNVTNQEVTLSVKGAGILYKTHFPANDQAAAEPLVFSLPAGATFYYEYHFPNREDASLVDDSGLEITALTSTDSTTLTRNIAYHSPIDPDLLVFGPMYRQWGQFEYNGNRARASLPINQSELVINNDDVEDPGEISDNPDELDGLFDPATAPFLTMLPDAKTQCYLGYDAFTYVSATVVSSSRLGEDNILPQPPAASGEGLSAPNRTTKTNEYSIAGGLGFSVVTGTASQTWVDTEVTRDVMDFNGDRYPDIVAGSAIQYTGMRGGYDPVAIVHPLPGHHAAKSEATGFTLGGSFVSSRPSNSGEPKGGASNKRSGKAKSRGSKLGKSSKNAGNTAGEAIGISGNFSEDNDYAEHSWTDINGDGLVDKVLANGTAALNFGYSFGPFENWGFQEVQRGKSFDGGGGLGVNLFNGSIAAGISLTRTDNFTTETLEDVNGDGLPDIVFIGDQTTVRLNTGTGFAAAINWSGLDQVDEGSATGESLNAAFTVCIPIFVVKICINPSTSIGRGVSRQLQQLDDVNGDGFPDLLRSTSDGELQVQRSNIGRTNLLKTINGPLGGNISLDYRPLGGTYDQPYTIWALERVATTTLMADEIPAKGLTTMAYEGGYHHRHERAFLGFATVSETQHDTENNDAPYRTYAQQFANENYYEQGLLLSETWTDSEGNRLRQNNYTYSLRNPENNLEYLPTQLLASGLRVFPALVQQTVNFYDDGGTIGLSSNRTFAYDDYGNLTRLTDLGAGHPEEFYELQLSYHYLLDTYQMGMRDSITIKDASGIVRQRTSSVSNGAIAQVRHAIGDGSFAVYDYTYDQYANTLRIVRPANEAGQRMALEYTYDTEVATYPLSETNSYGQRWERTYDYRYGRELSLIDQFGELTTTTLDDFGRPQEVLNPVDRDAGAPYSVRYVYQSSNGSARLQEDRWDPEFQEAYTIYAFADSDGLLRQEQQTAEVTSAADQAAMVQWLVSGKPNIDPFGRVFENYYPKTIAAGMGGAYQSVPDGVAPQQVVYDELDRPVKVIDPAGNEYTMSYGFGTTPSGVSCQQTSMIDPLGGTYLLLEDSRNRLLAEAQPGPNGPVWTSYTYRATGERSTVVDAAGNSTTYEYDLLGRLTDLQHPDAGDYAYTYDAAGNLLTKTTPAINAREIEDAAIRYYYDYDRLLRIDYPFNPQNQVRYTWGDTSATDYRNGRVYLVEDASGAQEVWYNQVGAIRKVVRTMIVNEVQQPTFVSEYEYDAWGRLKQAYYPDGEMITYTFDRSGNVRSLRGEKEGRLYEYVTDCRYDKFGDRLLLAYANEVELTMGKDAPTGLINSFKSRLPGSALSMDEQYTYDPLGNLKTLLDNTAPNENTGARRQQHQYAYDTASRLESATGSWESPAGTTSFNQQWAYDELDNPLLHTLEVLDARSSPADTVVSDQLYAYESDRPHFATQLGPWARVASPDGHLQEANQEESFQLTQYDEEGRLTAFAQDGYISRYAYAADGSRAIKSHGPGAGVFLNATPLGGINHAANNYTLYVSPLLEITADSFVKHYYLEDLRVLTKKGTGYFASDLLPPAQQITAGNIDLADRLRRLRELLLNFTEDLGLPPGHPSLPFYYLDNGEDASILPQPENNDPRILPPPGWPAPAGPPDPNGPPGHPVWYAEPASPDNVEAGYGYTNPFRTPELELFYYHHNPQGDVVQVSNNDGQLIAQQTYLPYGDFLVAEGMEQLPVWQAFRGRVYEEETGLYYLDGRYYDARTGMWLMVNQEQATQSSYLYAQGRLYHQKTLKNTLLKVQDAEEIGELASPVIDQSLANDGGDFVSANFTFAGGPVGSDVTVSFADDSPSSGKKNGSAKTATSPEGGSGGEGGVVRNKSLLALRRQFQQNRETGEKENTATPSPVATAPTQKQLNRRFVIRPGDYAGLRVVGNRYVPLGPDIDRKTVRRYRRVVKELKTRFRTDR